MTRDPADRASVARLVARAALLGGRGNSGVILSVIVRGAADVLGEAQQIDRETIATALRSASRPRLLEGEQPGRGHDPHGDPRARRDRGGGGRGRRSSRSSGSSSSAVTHAVLRTQEQLDVLRDAGVVDAGAAGLLEVAPRDRVARHGGAAAGGARGGAGRDRVGAPGAVAVPLLHRLRHRGRRARRGRRSSGSSPRSATRCSSSATRRRSRCTSTPTTPGAHSSSRRRWASSRRSRS